MKKYILIVITLCLVRCSEEVSPPDNTVHLAGFVGSFDQSLENPIASYWKNGVYTDLTNEGSHSQATSLYVDGTTVLIGGWKREHSSSAVIWKNGKEDIIDGSIGTYTLTASHNNNLFSVWFDGSTGWVFDKNGNTQPIVDTARNIEPTALALAGDDLYTSGCSWYSDGPDSFTYRRAQCWKNGQLIFRESESEFSNAFFIFIHQTDIYIAGHRYSNASPKSIACYWKNGQRVDLTDGTKDAWANSIFVTDAHVYASGTIKEQAVYWKDGVATLLTTGTAYSMANSIFVQGEDVHVAGSDQWHPAYWKNDVKQTIANQDKFGEIRFIVVGSN